MAWKRSKKEKIQFPVAVRGSKTSVLKLANRAKDDTPYDRLKFQRVRPPPPPPHPSRMKETDRVG